MKRFLFINAILIIVSFRIEATITMPAVFSNNMVLQRNKLVEIWGKAVANDSIIVVFAGQTKKVVSDSYGNFRLWLDPLTLSNTPRTLTIKCNSDSVKFENILVGDVYLCSGQSNMQFKILQLLEADRNEIALDSNYPKIRFYQVAKNYQSGLYEGNDTVPDISWVESNYTNISSMSAIAFYFARQLYKEKNIPVGIIDCSQGSSSGDAWISEEYIASHPELQPYLFAKASNEYQYFRDPGVLYRQMLSRIIPYTINAVLWYQGESNATTYFNYKKVFPAVIDCFRSSWNDSSLPFVFAQLAGYGSAPCQWQYIREVQDSVSKAIPNTLMVSTIDVGDKSDIHPKDKKTVGKRFLRAISNLVYKDPIEYSGPDYKLMRIEGNKIVIHFEHANNLHTNGNILDGLEISGSNNVYKPVTGAQIIDNELVVWNDKIDNPCSVRYSWANYSTPNLYNSDNLPANPFRTIKNGPTEIWVSAKYGDDSNLGIKDSPLKSIKKAVSLLEDFSGTEIKLFNDEVFDESGIIIDKNKTVVFDGNGSTILANTQKRTASDRILYQSAQSKMYLKNIKLENGYAKDGDANRYKSGGAVYSEGDLLDIDSCYFINNVGAINGGAIINYALSMNIKNSYFEGNVADGGCGGAIAQFGVDASNMNKLTINSTTFSHDSTLLNAATGTGGAVHIQTTSAGSNINVFISNCLFYYNYATYNYQGVLQFAGYQSSKSLLVNNTFYKNRSAGIRIENTLHDVTLVNNVVVGGLYGLLSNLKSASRIPFKASNNIFCGTYSSSQNVDDPCLNEEKEKYNNIVDVSSNYPLSSFKLSEDLIFNNNFIPYQAILDKNSLMVDKGIDEYLVENSNIVPIVDIRGHLKNQTKDVGCFEFDNSTSLLENHNMNNLHIYPNPTSGCLKILCESDMSHDSIKIINTQGTLVSEMPFQKNVSLNFFKQGVYIIDVGGKRMKIIKI